jgi:hypothetical protein
VKVAFAIERLQILLLSLQVAHEDITAFYADFATAIFVRVEDFDFCAREVGTVLVEFDVGELLVCYGS